MEQHTLGSAGHVDVAPVSSPDQCVVPCDRIRDSRSELHRVPALRSVVQGIEEDYAVESVMLQPLDERLEGLGVPRAEGWQHEGIQDHRDLAPRDRERCILREDAITGADEAVEETDISPQASG